MVERIASTATLQVTLYFPKSITLDDVRPAYRAWDKKNAADLVAMVITCIATDEAGNKQFTIADAPYFRKQKFVNVKEWFLLVGKMIKELNILQKSQSEPYRTSFSYPPGQVVFVKKD